MRTETSSVKDLPGMHLMGHTCTNLNGELLFIWGGTNENVAYPSTTNADLWIYETLTGYWRRRTCSGECPPYLSSSATCLIGQKMYVFGGHSTAQDNWMNSLYCLDLETFVWRDLGSNAHAEPTMPIRSDKNVCWSHEGRLYVFGGYGWSQTEHYLELLDRQRDFQLTPDYRWPKFGWNNQLVEYDPRDNTWRWPSYSGKCPSARAAHSGALMGNKYYVFGGRDCNERLNDLYTFDMNSFEWNTVAVISGQPSCSRIRPIRHLLEEEDEEEEDNDENDHYHEPGEARDDENEMVDEYEEDVLSPSPSSSLPRQQQVPNGNISPSKDVELNSASVSQGELDEAGAEESEDDLDEQSECFVYPHPSHLLERWSLSSHQSSTTTNTTGSSELQVQSNCQENQEDEERQRQQSSLNQAATLIYDSIDIERSTRRDNESTVAQSNNQTQQQQQQQQHQQQRQHIQLAEQAQATGLNNRRRHEQPPLAPADPLRQEIDNNNNGPGGDVSPTPRSSSSSSSSSPSAAHQPTGRSFSSFTPVSDENILLFGGVSSQDQKLDDCWLFNIRYNYWKQIDLKHKPQPRLWHTGARTKNNEIVIIGGSNSDKIDEYCTEVLTLSLEPKTLKRLALDVVSKSIRMRNILKVKGLPPTVGKQIRLRKQAMALTMRKARPMASNAQQQQQQQQLQLQ